MRNRLYVWKKYFKAFPGYILKDIKRTVALIGTIILFEENKIKNLVMTQKGVIDFFKNKYGPYDK